MHENTTFDVSLGSTVSGRYSRHVVPLPGILRQKSIGSG